MSLSPKEPKQPLDYVMRQLHDAMEMAFAYDRDPSFVADEDQLVMFEMLHKQIVGYCAASFAVLSTMRRRARRADS